MCFFLFFFGCVMVFLYFVVVLLKRGKEVSIPCRPSFLTLPYLTGPFHPSTLTLSLLGGWLVNPHPHPHPCLSAEKTPNHLISPRQISNPQVTAWAPHLPLNPHSGVLHLSVASTIFHLLSQTRNPKHPISCSQHTTYSISHQPQVVLLNASRSCLGCFSPSPSPPHPTGLSAASLFPYLTITVSALQPKRVL